MVVEDHADRPVSPYTVAARWGTVLLWAALIFILSAQPSLGTNLGVWDYIMRKSAHMAEYAVFFLLLRRALSSHVREGTATLLAVFIALGYAASDEWHQTFVPGRSGKVLDVGFDFAGIVLALAVSESYRRRRAAAG